MEYGEMCVMERGAALEEAGKPAKWIGFVMKGCFKYTVHNGVEGKDYITSFAFENEFVGDYPNCLSKKYQKLQLQPPGLMSFT